MQGKLVQAEYHLSLSRTVAVRKHQIQPLLADLRRCLADTPRRAAGIPDAGSSCLFVHTSAGVTDFRARMQRAAVPLPFGGTLGWHAARKLLR